MEVYRVDSDNLSRIEEQELSSEEALENDLIRSDGAQIGGVEVLYIDRQSSPGDGGIFDIVGVDEQGDVVIIELKRGRSPRDIVAQALEYAASIRNEDYEQLASRYREFVDDNDASLKAKHTEFFDREEDPLSEREYNTDQRLLLVGSDFSDLSLDMADFLREHGIDVICVAYSSFATGDGDLQLLTTEGIRRPLSEEPASVSGEEGSAWESTVEILDGDSVIQTFEERNQSDAMEHVAEYLIEEFDLLDRISIPYIPGQGDRALLNTTSTHPDGSQMDAFRELDNGYYILTKLDSSSKRRHLNTLAQECGLNARLDM